MSNLAINRMPDLGNIHRREPSDPELHYGVVAAVEKKLFKITGPYGLHVASRAASCLLDPQEGDRVLLAGGHGESWILAVLERPGEQNASLSFEGELEVNTPNGGIHMAVADSITTSSTALLMSAEKASGIFGSIDVTASASRACISSVTTVMEKMNVFCKHMKQHFFRSQRRVDGREEEYAAERSIEAEDMRIQAQTTNITAGERVAVNATQFHVN